MDIVERLRAEGSDAMRDHLSLGMAKLCSEAADEIEKLRSGVRVAHVETERDSIASELAEACREIAKLQDAVKVAEHETELEAARSRDLRARVQALEDMGRPFAEAYRFWAPKTPHLTISISTKDLARAAELVETNS